MTVGVAIKGNIVHKDARVDALAFRFNDEPWFKESEAEAEESEAEAAEPEAEAEESEAEAEAEAAPAASAATIPTTPPGKRTLDFSSLEVDVQRAQKRLKSTPPPTPEEIDEILRDIEGKLSSLTRAIEDHVYVRKKNPQLKKELNHLERVLQETRCAHQAREDEMSKPSEAQKAFVAAKNRFVDVVVKKYNLGDLIESLGISD